MTITNGTAHMTGDVSCPVKLLGGSFRLDGTAAVAFSNETEAVHCVTVSNLTAGAEIAVGGLPAYYGTDGIFADENGDIYIWLPDFLSSTPSPKASPAIQSVLPFFLGTYMSASLILRIWVPI